MEHVQAMILFIAGILISSLVAVTMLSFAGKAKTQAEAVLDRLREDINFYSQLLLETNTSAAGTSSSETNSAEADSSHTP